MVGYPAEMGLVFPDNCATKSWTILLYWQLHTNSHTKLYDESSSSSEKIVPFMVRNILWWLFTYFVRYSETGLFDFDCPLGNCKAISVKRFTEHFFFFGVLVNTFFYCWNDESASEDVFSLTTIKRSAKFRVHYNTSEHIILAGLHSMLFGGKVLRYQVFVLIALFGRSKQRVVWSKT